MYAAAFWKGVLLEDFTKKGTMISAKQYTESVTEMKSWIRRGDPRQHPASHHT
jgi:hypothetical protein